MAKHKRTKKADASHEATEPKQRSSSSRANVLEKFDGDRWNPPGLRSKKTGVVIAEGPEFEERQADHLASLDAEA